MQCFVSYKQLENNYQDIAYKGKLVLPGKTHPRLVFAPPVKCLFFAPTQHDACLAVENVLGDHWSIDEYDNERLAREIVQELYEQGFIRLSGLVN